MNKAFILLTSLFILILFSFLSINIIQNKSYSSKIDTIKYYEIQARIHMKFIHEKLKHNISIQNIDINDSRYNFSISKIKHSNNNISYNIYLQHKIEHISLYSNLSLK